MASDPSSPHASQAPQKRRRKSAEIPFDDSIPLDAGFVALGVSWERSLRARNRSARTITVYLDAHRRFGAFLQSAQLSQDVTHITREHVEQFIAYQLHVHHAATALLYYRSLQQFFKWLLEEDEIHISPMARMRAPSLPELTTPVLAIEELRAILHACEGSDFLARRDTAIIRVLIDTGMRRNELASMTVEQTRLSQAETTVYGKGARERVVPLGRKAVAAIDRYMRVRARHRYAAAPELWIGQEGGLAAVTIYQIVQRRARQAGLDGVYTHLFRHTFASEWLEGGGSEGDAMEIAGWRTRDMLDRYGRAARSKRARESHKRLSPGDRI